MQSEAVCSLNHDTTTPFTLTHTPTFKKFTPLTQVLQCKGAPICPFTAEQNNFEN